MVETEIAFILLFLTATVVAVASRRLKMPYTVALVITGLLLRAMHAFDPPHLTKDLLYVVFLPALLFDAAFHLEFKKYWMNRMAIHGLAIPGVAVAVCLTAVVLTPLVDALDFVQGFAWIHGLVFASLIAATDPVAVVGLFKSLGAPKRLMVLLEGESLLNDGTAVVFFSLVLAVAAGKSTSASGAAIDFLRVVGFGLMIGTAIGYVVSRVIQQVNDPLVEITLTVLAAYGSFTTAEHYHFSGVIATVVAGMFCGNYAARTGMSASTRVAVETFWEYLSFAMNSIVFLLIGFEVRFETLGQSWAPILVAFLAVLLARFLVVGAVTALLRPTRERIPWRWSLVLGWGGLRGGLSMVLVLGLAPEFPHRDLLLAMTFGVVFLSILIQGLTMPGLLRRLQIVGAGQDQRDYERKRGSLRSVASALKELDHMVSQHAIHSDVLDLLKEEYQGKKKEAEEGIRAMHLEQKRWRDEEYFSAKRHLLVAEKDSVIQSFHGGFIGQEAMEELLQQIDEQLLKLEEGPAPAAPDGGKEQS